MTTIGQCLFGSGEREKNESLEKIYFAVCEANYHCGRVRKYILQGLKIARQDFRRKEGP